MHAFRKKACIQKAADYIRDILNYSLEQPELNGPLKAQQLMSKIPKRSETAKEFLTDLLLPTKAFLGHQMKRFGIAYCYEILLVNV